MQRGRRSFWQGQHWHEGAGQEEGSPGGQARGADGVSFSVLRLHVMAGGQSISHCYLEPWNQNFCLLQS